VPVQLSYPGVYIEEVPSGVRTITGVATSIGLFIGWAARGPVDEAVRVLSFADYERTYGGLDRRTLLGYAVQQFFNNGGADAYVIRVTPVIDPENPPAFDTPVAATATVAGLEFTAASPGAWAEEYSVRITPRTDEDFEDRFKVEVVLDKEAPIDGPVVEVFENLSVDEADGRFAETVINDRSRLIRVSVPSGAAAPAAIAEDTFADGADGDVLDPNSTEAAVAAAFHQAVVALFNEGAIADRIDLFNLVCVPGESNPPTIQTLRAKCAERRAFLIVDCTEEAAVDSAVAEAVSLNGAHPSYAAYYFPWVRSADPLRQGAIRAFPPCGYVAGIYARTDAARGVWKAPAGTDAALVGVAGFTVRMSDAENGTLNPHGVNCLRTLPVYGNVVWGARTMDGDDQRASEWKYVPVRRMALFLEESLFRGTQWVVFEPNDEPLWSQIRLNIGAFMQTLFRQGAFQGRTPREAYFVKCDRETTTQADINRGVVNIHVGFAPLKPAEFVVIRIQQIAGELQT
jgi:phage tail sheath protein FI